MIKYSESWKSLVVYIWRTWRLELVDERGEGEYEGDDGDAGEEEDGYDGVGGDS